MKPRRTTILTLVCACLLVGLAAGRRWPLSTFWLAALIIPVILRKQWLLFLVLSLGLGWWRGNTFRQELLIYEQLYGRQVTVRVTAKTDGVYAPSRNLAFDGGDVHLLLPHSREPPGILKIEAMGIPGIFRGDRVEITGQLYPSGGARQGSIKFAQGRVISRSIGWLEKFRLKFMAGLLSTLPEPQASFGLGILVGQRSTLPKEVGDSLSAVGLTHIIAVSGYNLTIIIRFLGKRLGRSKYQTLTISTIMIAAFILITGFSASIVRAGIVSMLSLLAWYYGRALKPLLLILMTAALTAGWYPIYVWSDIGWYLSFLAFFGVIILAPLVTVYFWHGREPKGLLPLAIESGCAQIMTIPIVLYIFGETSLIALPANMLIVPLVPLAMLLAAAGGLFGLLLPGIASWVAWPGKILLGYMLQVVDLLSHTPHALASFELPALAMVAGYIFISLICWHLWVKTRTKYVKITDEGELI